MATKQYTINWTDGSLKQPFSVTSETKDKSTSLTLVGSGAMEWGKEYQENMVRLLENFASNSKPPINPTVGQFWFNTADNFLKVYSPDSTWTDVKKRRIDSTIPPVGNFYPGDLWFDSGVNQLKVFLNEGVWSDPMSGALVVPRPVPVPTVTPTPTTPVSPTPVSPTPVPTPSPVSPTPAPALPPTYTMPSHSVAYFGPAWVWGLDGSDGVSRVAVTVPSMLMSFYPQLTVSNEGVIGENISKLITGTDGVHTDFDNVMSTSSVNIVILGSFGYEETAAAMTPTNWQSSLTTAVHTAQKYGKRVILVSMHLVDSSKGDMAPFVQIMQDVATNTGAGYIDLLQYTTQNFTGSITSWLPDGLIPNQNGYNVIGHQILSQYPIVYKKLTSVDNTPAPTANSDPLPFGQDATLYPTLTFSEEFNGSSLGQLWSLGNWYETPNSLSNYTVNNGVLTVWAQQKQDGTWDPHNFTCTTDGTFYQRYGYFEVEAKLPYGTGVWPAFWMYTHDDSTRPEIVMMQTWPSETTVPYGDINYHPRNYTASAQNSAAASIGQRNLLGSLYNSVGSAPDLSLDFHKYGARWDSTGVQFYFDGQPLGSKLISTDMTKRMFFVIDLWIGGKALDPDGNTPTTANRGMAVNYFRAWSLNDGTTQVSGSSVGTPTPAPTPTPSVPSPSITPAPTVTPTPTGIQPFGQSGSYYLTFNDEFSAGSLDFTKWNDHVWYEISDPTINYKQQNGSLFIWPASGFVNRTIDTDGKFSQVYGYFEIEAKLPYGKGLWPAFWLYRHDDSAGNKARPEIDIMEAYPGGGVAGGWGDANLHATNYGATLHEANVDYSYHEIPLAVKLTDFFPAVDLSAGYHKYALKWESTGITFYFDGQPLGSKWIDSSGYFDQPMYVLLDLWFGSASGNPDSSTPTGINNSFEIRYVRCWSFGSSSPGPAPTPVPTVTPTPIVPTPVPSPSQAPTQMTVIDYYGDSTIYGYLQGGGRANPTPVQTFAANLQYSSWYQVNNKGVSGQGTDRLLGNGSDAWYGGVPPLDQLLQQSNAKYCIFNHLLNDADPNQENNTTATYETNLRQIVAMVRSYGKIVIFETPNPTANYPIAAFLTVMRNVASDLNVPIIDEYTYVTGYISSNGLSIYDVEPDGSHPNQTMYNLKGVYAAQQFSNIV